MPADFLDMYLWYNTRMDSQIAYIYIGTWFLLVGMNELYF